MAGATTLGIPELAGIASYREASRIGFSVEENVRRLLRYQWVERRLASILIERLSSTPEWEVKGGFALHQWLDIEHATGIAQRLQELCSPVPPLDIAPDEALELFLQEVEQAQDTMELLAGVYRVAREDLVLAYREHMDTMNPLVDHPTRRVLRTNLQEQEEALGWGARSLGSLIGRSEANEARVRRWEAHLRAFLGQARGAAGDLPPSFAPLPPRRGGVPRSQDFEPRRDARFTGQYNFSFPPHVVSQQPDLPAAERNIALLCRRLLEMDVPETISAALAQEQDRPWQFYRDYSRLIWDEARHAMMGEAAFQLRGIDWTRLPLNLGFSLRLILHATPQERRLLLYAIEQASITSHTGKRYERNTAEAAGDPLSAHFQDYDWADEVLHAQIGRRWLREEGLEGADLEERARDIHARTWQALEQYRQRDIQSAEWWRDFVRLVLGTESEATEEMLRADPGIIAQ